MEVNTADNRRMDKMGVEVGMKESFNKKLVSSLGHVERMGDDELAEIRCPESGGKQVARKTNNVRGGMR